MKKNGCRFMAILMLFSALLLAADNGFADCVSQYCACDGKMHDCGFSEEDCRALCGGTEPQYQTGYRDSSMDALYIGFAVAFVAIGVILYFSGAFNEPAAMHPAMGISF